MEKFKKALFFFFLFFSAVVLISSFGILLYTPVEGSDFAAWGLIPVTAVFFYLLGPSIKRWLQ